MADLIKKIKIKKQDGTFTDYIPIGADAVNIAASDGESVELKLNKKPYYYNTVADMKADTKLKAGDVVQTLGYYSANDGGGAEYKIVNDNTLVDDGGSYHRLKDALYAELIIKDGINVHQFGAYGDGTHDDTTFIQNIITYCSNNNKKYNIYFLGKTYLIDNLQINTDSINLWGVKTSNTLRGTILKSKNSEYPAIFIGQNSGMWVGGSINNIAIMGAGERQNYNTALNKIGIKMKNIAEFNFTNVFISGFKLGGIYAEDWWDSINTSLEIRACGNSTGNPALYLGSDDDSCNSLHFYGLHIEECPFQMHINNVCSHIQFTDSKFERGGNFGNSYTHLIEIYEGVYATVFTGCFFANNATPLHLLIKNNSTTLEGCMFSSSSKQLIKNYSPNSSFGKGIIINACQFEGLNGEYPIDLDSNAIFTNNRCTFTQSVENNCIKINSDNLISNNNFRIGTSGEYKNGILYFSGASNIIESNKYSSSITTVIVASSNKNNYIDTHSNDFGTRTEVDVDFTKTNVDILYNGPALTLTNDNIKNPFSNSRISFFTNNDNLTIGASLLGFNHNISLKANTIITLRYVSAIAVWKVESLASLQDIPSNNS